jgi:hypothetical protein
MVERTPPINERLYGLGSASAPAWRLPAWMWHAAAKHLAQRPDVIRQPGCHGRCLQSAVLQSETAMHRTEVIHGSHQIHTPRHGRCPARRTPRSAAQDRQATAKCAVQTLNERGIEHLTSGCAPQQGQKHLSAPLHQAMECAHHHAPGVLFDDLGDRQVGPDLQSWATTRPQLARPKRLAYCITVGRQAIAHEQQWPAHRTSGYDGDQPPDQGAVTMRTDRAPEPQPRADHHRHRHPQHASLGLDMHLIGLHLLQIARLHDHTVMDCFGMCSSGIDPLPHGLGLQCEGGFNRGNGTAMADQGHNLRDHLLIRPPAKEDRAASGTEGLLADRTAIAVPLVTMDADIAFAKLSSCRTVDIRAKCALRIDDTPPFGPKHRRVSRDPLTFSSPIT